MFYYTVVFDIQILTRQQDQLQVIVIDMPQGHAVDQTQPSQGSVTPPNLCTVQKQQRREGFSIL